jgi:hypothetical protein
VITFQVEDWTRFYPDLAPLAPLHWEEVATNKDKIKLNLDLRQYGILDSLHQLHIVTVRQDGFLVGYHWSIVRPHLHYTDSLTAYTDVYFVRKDVRNFQVAVGLFKFVEASLKARGVQKMFTGTKKSLDVGGLFKMLGWTHSEDTYIKMIGD